MKRFLVFGFWLLAFVQGFAAIGDWRTYLAYSDIQDIVSAGDIIYVMSSNNLFSYDTADESVTEYNKVANLSDTYISKIAYCKSAQRLIVVYDDSNIDLIDDDGTVTNVSDIYRTTLSDKTINNIDVYGQYAYLSTSFGVVKLNVRAAEISETYKLKSRIWSVAEYNGKVYVAPFSSGYFVGVKGDNLIDPSNWKFVSGDPAVRLMVVDNKLMGYRWDDFYPLDADNLSYDVPGRIANNDMPHYSFNDGTLILWNSSTAVICRDGVKTTVRLNLGNSVEALCYNKNTKSYWHDFGGCYLTSALEKDGYLVTAGQGICPDSPRYNDHGFMTFCQGVLYTCGGGYSADSDLKRRAAVQKLDDDGWTIFQDDIDSLTGYDFVDANAIAVDPLNTSRLFTGGRTGIYEYLDTRFVRAYNNSTSGDGKYVTASPLQTASGLGDNRKYVMAQALCFDESGELWCYNSQAPDVNLLSLGRDGEWTNHYFLDLMNQDTGGAARSLGNVVCMICDSRGYLWFCNNHWDLPSLFCYIPSQNKLYSYKKFINEDGTDVNPYYIRCIAEDQDGNIWIGTSSGPLYLAESEFFAASPVFEQVKVPRNDGTSLADYLLAGVNISSIAVDAGNRKWFATSNNGVYEISADNIVELNNYTVENSPLLSNNIESLAYNSANGKMFFGTDRGLCSLETDASEPSEDIDDDKIWAYPNPVVSDYNGLITVVGLTNNAQVKIVSSSGMLIAEGTSNGGTFTWDGMDSSGKRVASGVYIVFAATSDGKKGATCKIAMIK